MEKGRFLIILNKFIADSIEHFFICSNPYLYTDLLDIIKD